MTHKTTNKQSIFHFFPQKHEGTSWTARLSHNSWTLPDLWKKKEKININCYSMNKKNNIVNESWTELSLLLSCQIISSKITERGNSGYNDSKIHIWQAKVTQMNLTWQWLVLPFPITYTYTKWSKCKGAKPTKYLQRLKNVEQYMNPGTEKTKTWTCKQSPTWTSLSSVLCFYPWFWSIIHKDTNWSDWRAWLISNVRDYVEGKNSVSNREKLGRKGSGWSKSWETWSVTVVS